MSAGRTVTGYRPSDHRWHKGLQMTASHLSGQNFWGGNSYVHGQGYLALPDRVGSMRHDGFTALRAERERLALTEELTWTEHGGREWAQEVRGDRGALGGRGGRSLGAGLVDPAHQHPCRSTGVRLPDHGRP
ncbi:hypothetical protein GCM10010300_58440 [Streptomyces olivaceoviridis]|nr:hypothetical protein GCM10010300_58440 [Streptomyces olivaceoviridis]